MTPWMGSPAGPAAGLDRRPHVAQGLAVAAVISLGVHLLAVVAPRTTLRGGEHTLVAHALAVRTIVLAPASNRPTQAAVAEAPVAAAGGAADATGAAQPSRAAPRSEPSAAGSRGSAAKQASEPSSVNSAKASTSRASALARGGAPSAYLPVGRLDPPPRPLHDIEPEYPAEAGFRQGTVVLRLLISESGAVDRVDVLRAEPRGLFDAAARDAFAAARFAPGRIAGIAVKCEMTVEVEFTPINRGNEVSGRTY